MNQKTNDKLSALKAAYVKRLKQEFEPRYSVVQQPLKYSAAEELKAYLHKVAGSGGSFGFASLSALCKAAELVLEQALENGINRKSDDEFLSKDELQNLHKLFDDIRNEVQRASYPLHEAKAEPEGIEQEDSQTDSSVWLVDDDKPFVDALAEQLISFGFEVTVFYDFRSFNEAISQSSPEFVIADVYLGQTETFFQQCTQNSVSFNQSQLIVMSSVDEFDLRVQAVRQNAVTFLQKPVDPNKLAKFLRERSGEKNAIPERVLLIDDDEELAQLYKLYLESENMVVQTLSKPEQVIECVREFRPEIIVIDLYMPDFSGNEVAALIRQYDDFAVVPIVYLSSESCNHKISQALMKAGDDFLIKPVDDYALSIAVKARVRRARQLYRLIQFDSLTGLLKHSLIKEAVSKELQRNRRTDSSMVVAMIDIDFFKKVNDSYGHAIGDTVIAALSTLLYQRMRQTDEIGRYGGEEFLVVLPNCDGGSARKILDDIRTRFEAIRFVSNNQTFNCTLSVGFTVIDAASGPEISAETAIDRADQALYVAKNNGRNRVEFYEGSEQSQEQN